MCEELNEERELTDNEREVADLRARMFADGKIDAKEAAELVALKKEKAGDTSFEFDNFYAECLVSFVSNEEGGLDSEKAKQVNEMIVTSYDSEEDEYLGDDLDDADYEFMSRLSDGFEQSEIEDLFSRLV